jgi:hypothetical protein
LTLVSGTATAATASGRYTTARLDKVDAGEEALALRAAVKITAFFVRLPAGARHPPAHSPTELKLKNKNRQKKVLYILLFTKAQICPQC